MGGSVSPEFTIKQTVKQIVLLLTFTFLTIDLYGQKDVTLHGFVYDESSGEVLIGASVYDWQSMKGVVTNEYGFYSITLPVKDTLRIIVSFVGYKPDSLLFASPYTNQQKNFYLAPGIKLREITVKPIRNNIVVNNETGVIHLKMDMIKTLPNLFGEVDIIKIYQLTPGVQSGGEAKSNLYVRGGSPDQNLILLDDVPLYYVAHFGGFFSIFNPDAINDVKLIKGGFPARYGSRLSSVLDIRMKEGNMKKLSFQGTIGLLSSRLSFEGPIIKKKLSFILSARKNLFPVYQIFGAAISYNFYDLNAKLNYRVSKKDKLLFSFYMGDDIVSEKRKTQATTLKNKIQWGNTLLSFRWNHVYHKKLFSNLTLSNTYYRYKNGFNYSMFTDTTTQEMSNVLLSGINDINLKLDYTWLINTKVNFRYGLNSTYHIFIPNDEDFSQSGNEIETINKKYRERFKALENAFYLENELRTGKINTNIGLRYSLYSIDNKTFNSLEPRVLINYIIRKDLSFKYSFSLMTQYIHLLSYSGTGIPSDYWMPATKNVLPENSLQHTLGMNKTFLDDRYELSLESYYKTQYNLITFKPGTSLLGNLDTWENVIEKNGQGKNYGIELFFQKIQGKTTGWIGITMAKAKRQFEKINEGSYYPFKYDRLLDISFVANYKINKKIIVSATWQYGTGYPITLAVEHYNVLDQDIFIYGKKNSFRMRDYHRLDIAVNFPKKTNWGERNWNISIFNIYNRQNPYYYYYDRKIKYVTQNNNGGISFVPVYDNLKLYQRSLFSIFPTVSYSFIF